LPTSERIARQYTATNEKRQNDNLTAGQPSQIDSAHAAQIAMEFDSNRLCHHGELAAMKIPAAHLIEFILKPRSPGSLK